MAYNYYKNIFKQTFDVNMNFQIILVCENPISNTTDFPV